LVNPLATLLEPEAISSAEEPEEPEAPEAAVTTTSRPKGDSR